MPCPCRPASKQASKRLIITADWQYDAAFVREVEVTLPAMGPSQMRVDLEHRDLERYGGKAEGLRKAIDSEAGWGKVMSEFSKAAQAG